MDFYLVKKQQSNEKLPLITDTLDEGDLIIKIYKDQEKLEGKNIINKIIKDIEGFIFKEEEVPQFNFKEDSCTGDIMEFPFLDERTRNCLRAAEIVNIKDLKKWKREDVMNFRNFGKQSMQVLEYAMKLYGINFKN